MIKCLSAARISFKWRQFHLAGRKDIMDNLVVFSPSVSLWNEAKKEGRVTDNEPRFHLVNSSGQRQSRIDRRPLRSSPPLLSPFFRIEVLDFHYTYRFSTIKVKQQQQQQMKHHQQGRTADVVIVGAGMAGLAAADRLRNAGIDKVVILEASNR